MVSIGVIMLLLLLLGCANYGVLLHKQIIAPPDIDIELGPYDLRSWVDYDPPCGPHPYCQGGPETRSKAFYVSVFIRNSTAPGAPQMVQLVYLPLAPT
jgi:hypothetical protein